MANKSNGMAVTGLAIVVSLVVAGGVGYMWGARSAPSDPQSPDIQVVAKVNDKVITKADLYEKMVKQGGSQLVDRMIEVELVNQIAQAQGVTVTPADVEAEMTKIKAQFGGEEQFAAALAQYGYTPEQLKEEQDFRLKVIGILGKEITTDDDTLKKYFDENFQQFDTTREVHSRHILVATEDEAKAVKAELEKDADFAALAKAKSTDPSAQTNSGDMGFNPRGKMVPEYDNVVFSLKKGEISAPFQSEYGWHVVQAVDMKGEAPTFETVKAQVKEMYVAEQAQSQMGPWLEEQKTKASIQNTLAK